MGQESTAVGTSTMPLVPALPSCPVPCPKTTQGPLGPWQGIAAQDWGTGPWQSCRAQRTENRPKSLGQGREGLTSMWEQVTLGLAPSRMEVPPLHTLLWGLSIIVMQKCLS